MNGEQTSDNLAVPKEDQKPGVRYRLPEEKTFRDLDSSDADQGKARDELKKFLVSSLQVQHLLVLAGSGTSIDSDGPSTYELWQEVSKLKNFKNAAKTVDYFPQEGRGNIEEFLSRCDAYRELHQGDREVSTLYNEAIERILELCRRAGRDVTKLKGHKEFLRRLARRRQRDSRVMLFTTNYDRCFELAAGELGLVPLDGFSFSQPRHFDPRYFRYDLVYRGIGSESPSLVPGVFQYFKLHGSVDWATKDGRIQISEETTAGEACLIYPARGKFQRSYEQPHLELMAHYLAALREPNTCLVVTGFGFNDSHLSGPILAALETNPHFRLIVVDPHAESLLNSDSNHWERLNELATRSDVGFVATTFATFAEMVPDLHALTPAQELVRAVRGVTGGSA
jgi:hypothetical protein